jgi:pSer/pThr/pTyr-binding forkhead associated (FHA) protein
MAMLTLRSAALPNGQLQVAAEDLPLSIGRSKRAGVVINDQRLSRLHSELRMNLAGRFEIVDLDSMNLTIVNGADVEVAELKTGDCILLGDTELSIEVSYPEENIHESTTRELPLIRPSDVSDATPQ